MQLGGLFGSGFNWAQPSSLNVIQHRTSLSFLHFISSFLFFPALHSRRPGRKEHQRTSSRRKSPSPPPTTTTDSSKNNRNKHIDLYFNNTHSDANCVQIYIYMIYVDKESEKERKGQPPLSPLLASEAQSCHQLVRLFLSEYNICMCLFVQLKRFSILSRVLVGAKQSVVPLSGAPNKGGKKACVYTLVYVYLTHPLSFFLSFLLAFSLSLSLSLPPPPLPPLSSVNSSLLLLLFGPAARKKMQGFGRVVV